MSQRELADAVRIDCYSLISQLEHGYGYIPADRYLVWADALKVEPREFIQLLTSYYDPRT